MLEPGTILENRYEIRKILGNGGFSRVYLAYDRETCRNRAVKELDRFSHGRIHTMEHGEADLIRKLQYPYFPEIEEVMEREGRCYIVMEYLEGETLAQVLERLGPQPWQQVVVWAKDMCLVLGYLHHCQPPVIYRDMKPANIMLQSGGNLRLLDFGAALELSGQETTVSLGTRGYAAPEQLAGESVDARTDIYGLGATMYHLLTGRDPCRFPCGQYSVRRWNPRLPRKLAGIVRKCTRSRPKERYSSCEALREALERI